MNRCSGAVEGWLTTPGVANYGTLVTLSKNADAATSRGQPAIELRGLRHLEDGAVLGMQVNVNRRNELLEYTIGLAGCLRSSGQPWFARVDLTEEPEGSGPCAHPLLHAHVGSDPDEQLAVRIPLAPLLPAEALDWLLATVDPDLEPRVDSP